MANIRVLSLSASHVTPEIRLKTREKARAGVQSSVKSQNDSIDF